MQMGLSEDDFVNAVSDNLKCAICTEVFDDPVFTGGRPCQHVFCRSCIDRALERNRKCPTCRANVKKNDLQRNQLTQSLLDEQIVRCTISASCGWTGRLDARPAHMSCCPMAEMEVLRARLEAQQQTIVQYQANILDNSEKLLEQQLIIAQGADRKRELEMVNQQQCLEIEGHRRKIARLESDLLKMQTTVDREAAALAAEKEQERAQELLEQAEAYLATAKRKATIIRLGGDNKATKAMQVLVKDPSGRTITLDVQADDSIEYTKGELSSKTGIPGDIFYLVLSGKILQERKLVSDYQIPQETHIFMCLRSVSSSSENATNIVYLR